MRSAECGPWLAGSEDRRGTGRSRGVETDHSRPFQTGAGQGLELGVETGVVVGFAEACGFFGHDLAPTIVLAIASHPLQDPV